MIGPGKSQLSPQSKGYVAAFLVSLPFWYVILFVIIIFAQRSVPSVYFLLILFIGLGPLFIVWLYVMYRALVPVTGGMPFKRFRQWAMLYPFMAGFGLFWAFLVFIFNAYLPFLSREDRETSLPVLVILAVTLILTLTRLRYRVADLLNRAFGMKPTEKSEDDNSQPIQS